MNRRDFLTGLPLAGLRSSGRNDEEWDSCFFQINDLIGVLVTRQETRKWRVEISIEQRRANASGEDWIQRSLTPSPALKHLLEEAGLRTDFDSAFIPNLAAVVDDYRELRSLIFNAIEGHDPAKLYDDPTPWEWNGKTIWMPLMKE